MQALLTHLFSLKRLRAKVELDARGQQMRGQQFKERLASQEQQTSARIDAAMQREILKQRGSPQ